MPKNDCQNKSVLNKANGLPSFSSNQYYGYKNEMYEAEESDSNEFDHCDCLRTSPLVSQSDKCKAGLDEDSYDEEDGQRKSKRSASNECSDSSSLKTLQNFNLNSALDLNKHVKVSALKAAASSKPMCGQMLLSDSALTRCDSLGIFNLTQLVQLCEQDYDSDEV